MSPSQLYDPAYVRNLFNEMAATYGGMNLITSFGFAALWRHQCLNQIQIPPNAGVVDLMTGMGELCPSVAARIGKAGKITGVDISPVMCDRARHNARRFGNVEVLEADALHSPLLDASADVVVCSFGLKTFSAVQWLRLGHEVKRILKPGGKFSFVEISVPPSRLLRIPYVFYISHIIPILGRLFLRNAECYRMLGIYTTRFCSAEGARLAFAQNGLLTEPVSFFFGCATGFTGVRP